MPEQVRSHLSVAYQAMLKEARRIKKTGYNKHHKYYFVTEADAKEFFHKLLEKHNLMVVPKYFDLPSPKADVTKVGLSLSITHIDDGFINDNGKFSYLHTIVVDTVGTGWDSQDKGSYKAMTGAYKYAILKLLSITTNDDPEWDNEVERGSQPEVKTAKETKKKGLSKVEKNDFELTPTEGNFPNLSPAWRATMNTMLREEESRNMPLKDGSTAYEFLISLKGQKITDHHANVLAKKYVKFKNGEE